MRTFLVLLSVATLLIVPFPTPRSHFGVSAGPPRATVLGYSRDAFGTGWAPLADGCTTRQAALNATFGASHVVAETPGSCPAPRDAPVAGPYTGEPITPSDVELDHVLPLSAAWDLGAHAWDQSRREAFANDPLNLVVVAAAANQQKSDQLPSEWMPSKRAQRCAYAHRLADVARTYELPLPRADLREMRRACGGIAGLLGARAM
ncbi:HNH endonuclease family protein [Corynebacterium imitans]|uniref:HNH endonuclease family protein n=1 Tax=Corynebacterium imitans TaxID=156978 RepID=UPI001EF373E4|nr:HNH endonuclease family protein [Corynebacterium imitans]MCG7278151.1 HNH endonuclease family protein [Corynebacterium imitans]